MTDLVACLSTGKGTWSSVIKLVSSEDFEKVYLITNDFGAEKFNAPDNTEMIILSRDSSEEEMREQVKNGLQDKIKDTEVALNLTSGSGREHMAILSALLQLGLGIRLVVPGEEGFKEV